MNQTAPTVFDTARAVGTRVSRRTMHLVSPYAAPRTATERALTEAWREALGVDDVGIDDDFFQLGGDSANAAEIAAVLSDDFAWEMAASLLAEAPTVRLLARALDDQIARRERATLLPIRPHGRGLPLVFVHGWGGDVTFLRRRSADLLPGHPLYGLRGRGLMRNERPLKTIAAMAEDHVAQIAETGLGPRLLIAGTCAGAIVAHELAIRLAARGAMVAGLILLEPPHERETAPWLHARQRTLGSELHQARWAFRLARRRLRRALIGPKPHHAGRDFIETFERALYHHRPGRLAAPALLLTSAHSAGALTEPTRGWPARIDGRVIHHVVGRDHAAAIAMGPRFGEAVARFAASL